MTSEEDYFMPKPRSSKPATHPSLFAPAVAELVAIGAAIGANCEPCFKHHYNEARKLGVSREDMVQAVELADRVKRAPAQNMRVLADKILGSSLSTQTPTDPNPGCCCSSRAGTQSKRVGRKCCDCDCDCT
jgi:AhpD family alkylhydroperoxidase